MLIDIDSKHHETFIIEDLDEEHLLVKDTMVAELKQRLQGVSLYTHWRAGPGITNASTDDEGTAQGARELRIRIVIITIIIDDLPCLSTFANPV